MKYYCNNCGMVEEGTECGCFEDDQQTLEESPQNQHRKDVRDFNSNHGLMVTLSDNETKLEGDKE